MRRTARWLLALQLLVVALILVHPKIATASPRGIPARFDIPLDQSTPRRSLQGYLDACHVRDFTRAAEYLDLRSIAPALRADDGPELAEQLSYVLDRGAPLDVAKVPDEPVVAELGASPLVVATAYVNKEPVPIEWAKVRGDDGTHRWLLARGTVASIPALYQAFGPPGFEAKLPPWLRRGRLYGNAAWQWLGLLLSGGVSYGMGRLLAWLGLRAARRAMAHARDGADTVIFEAARRPLRILLASILFREGATLLHITNGVSESIGQVTFALIVFTIAWFSIRALRFGVEWASLRLPAEPEHEIRYRVLRTQLTLLRQIAVVVIVVVAIATVLMQFAFVRNVGVSLLASAGLFGIVFGFAAQKSLAGLIGGIQLSITQPIRIGDTVFVEKELGTVERIHLTYVVVRLREQRMLVVPVARFLDTSFENWTIAAPDVVGSVLLSVDFATPVDQVRTELARACAGHEAWDQRICVLEVTDVTERTMTLRALVSSSDAAKSWALRCFVRERLMAYLAALEGGRYLPSDRVSTVPSVTA